MRLLTEILPTRAMWLSVVVLAGCSPQAATSVPVRTECELDANVLLACGDESCDLEALDAALAHCPVGTKVDGIGDTLDRWGERIQERLAPKAQECYERQDVGCLKRVYYALAAGGYVKGLKQAARMMWNFLRCDEDPIMVDADTLKEDEGIAAVAEWYAYRAAQQMPGPYSLIESAEFYGGSPDIYYAMGALKLSATPSFAVGGIDLQFVASDRYDWHGGFDAGGPEEGVAAFEDNWANFLVEQGAACEFEMLGTWNEYLSQSNANALLTTPPKAYCDYIEVEDVGCGDPFEYDGGYDGGNYDGGSYDGGYDGGSYDGGISVTCHWTEDGFWNCSPPTPTN